MSTETYLNYRNYRWLWICLGAVLLMTVLYFWDNPVGGRNGGTVLGYTYGVLAASGILYLMYYGIRKRSFNAKYTTLRGTLAAHVWIGVALIFIVPLHSGFHFGLNVHTLAYVLMLLVIFSGIWGVVMYAEQPGDLRSQRGGGTMRQLLQQINSITGEIEALIGGTTETKLKSDAFVKLLTEVDFRYEPSLWRSLRGINPEIIPTKRMAQLVSSLPEKEREDGRKLIGLANRKREIVCALQEEARAQTLVRAWLFLHLPVSFALLAALFVHIWSVFFYW